MSFVWTDAHIKDKNIIDSSEFDTGYNALKGTINGGLDRENIQNDSVGTDHLRQDSFLSYAVKEGVRCQGPLERREACFGNFILGKTYNLYNGGFVTNSAQKLSKRFIEGMLHIEFNSWYYLNNQSSDNTATADKFVSGRWCLFTLNIDNVEVSRSEKLWSNVGTVRLIADIPITTGVHEVTVSWQATGYIGGYGTTMPAMKSEPLFYYDGGTILAINRYR